MIPIVLGIIQFSFYRRILILPFLIVVSSFLSDFLSYNFPQVRLYVWPVFITIQFILLSLIYRAHSIKSQIKPKFIYSIIVFLAYAIIYEFYLKANFENVPNLMTISVFVFIILSIRSFIEIYNTVTVDNLLLYPFFWINTAVLIYFSGNLYLTVSYNIFTMQEVYKLYIPIHNSLNTVKNLLFAVAFLVHFINSRSTAKI
jgi:hypothetical protein